MQIILNGEELTKIVRKHIESKTGMANPMRVLLSNSNDTTEILAKYFTVRIDISETPEVK
jgi:hypothetical protein